MSDNHAERWKKKYLDLAEEAEEQENRLLAFENLLKSALVRMSLAAEGQDRQLDKMMHALRRSLRDSHVDRNAIAPQLEAIDQRLLAIENESGAPADAEPEPADSASLHLAADRISDISRSLQEAQDDGAGLSLSERQEEELATVVTVILESLPEDDFSRPLIDRIRCRIKGSLDWEGWLTLLQQLAELIQLMLGASQASFGGFLATVDEKLNELQSIFTGPEIGAMLEALHSGHSQSELNASVAALREDMSAEFTDMESLRESVTRSLDAVTHSVDTFIQREAAKQAAMHEQLSEMQAQLEGFRESARQARVQLEKEQVLARTDTLTGLPNRLAWRVRLAEETDRFARYGRPLSMVIFDIDHFKQVNDEFGHPAGDRVLRLIGQELSKRMRRTDFLARLGGEEFILLMTETTGENAHAVANKMRDRVGRMPFNFKGKQVSITVSAGIAQFREGDDHEQVFERADAALYEAKTGGRNQVRFARSS